MKLLHAPLLSKRFLLSSSVTYRCNPPIDREVVILRRPDFAAQTHGIAHDERILARATRWRRADGGARTAGARRGVRRRLQVQRHAGARRDSRAAGSRDRRDRGCGVLAFDDLDEAAYSLSSLTNIDPGRQWTASAAVETLLERIGRDGPSRWAAAPSSRCASSSPVVFSVGGVPLGRRGTRPRQMKQGRCAFRNSRKVCIEHYHRID